MISYEIFCRIRHLRDRDGLNRAQIAADLSLDLRTVGKWLDEKQFRSRKKSERVSKLDRMPLTAVFLAG
jgi:DNA-binding transcriptional regulator YiaG